MSTKRPLRIFVGETSATSDGGRHRAVAREYAFAEDGNGGVVPLALNGQVESRYFLQGHRAWAEMEGRVRRLCEAGGAGSRVFWNRAALIAYFNSAGAEERDLLRISHAHASVEATDRVWATPSSWGEAHQCGVRALDAYGRRRAGEDAEAVHILRDERGGHVLVVGMRDTAIAWASPEGYDKWFAQDIRTLARSLQAASEQTAEPALPALAPR
ncbi:hypothetical protein BHAOGJBA_4507 [Methylobacterium hispanicum]|uniref:Uncharacterized protein n=2 Tax=Methylobacterium hispanicum TaxID=270350 RepID=A0AAV4ZSX3_9HYPH|nr:hypothetical protein BHAOGJBA_4507 [Methylobacterium hispanicum]